MITILIVAALAAAYGCGLGYTHAVVRHSDPYASDRAVLLVAALWPVCLPAVLVWRRTTIGLVHRHGLPPARVVKRGDR